MIVPKESAAEAALVEGISIYPAEHLLDVSRQLIEGNHLATYKRANINPNRVVLPDLSEVRGQPHAKRALVIAAAGCHNLLMIGPPGTGKSMLASRLPGILPDMTEAEALESAAILSISNQGFTAREWRKRPFRTPHHTASGVALAGGGSNPRPGEISLAHNGVMFLDELPEFDRKALEILREPLETGRITISRAARQEVFPSRFQLITAMNPCPCGYFGDTGREDGCRCTADQVARYRNRISGPLLDRIDMHIEVPVLPAGILSKREPEEAETSAQIRQRVENARQRQLQRSGCTNSRLSSKPLESACMLADEPTQLLLHAMERLRLSARAYHRILRLALTIADLEASNSIQPNQISEAISYRRLDRRT